MDSRSAARRTGRWLWVAALAATAAGLGCEDDSPTEPEPSEDVLEASATGDREFVYEGDARFHVDEGSDRFVLISEGTGSFEGASLEFLANFNGMPEIGTYTLGPPPGPDDEEFDLSSELRTFSAIFGATDGSVEITSLTAERLEGTFSYTAERTHVCGTVTGNCESLPGGDPPVIEVEGTFIAIPPEGGEGS